MPQLSTAMEIGKYGERVAADFLRGQGYKILTRNFKTTRGEIDLVCRHENMLVFVEVRARSDKAWVHGAESINQRKEDALHYAARHYLELLERDDIDYRFDAVELRLTPGEVPTCILLPNFC